MTKFGIELFYSHGYDFVRKKVEAASKENWDSIWLPDHLSGIPGAAIDDFLCLWPMFGSFAELAPEKTLGSSVTDPHRLHPAALAQMATTIDHISNGKFILGIGAGEGMNLKAYNIPHDHAVSKMKESIELMKLFWKKGKRVTYKGTYFQTKKAVLLPKPTSKIPIWVAANGPMSRRITSEVGDGWMPIGLFPDVYKAGKDEITKIIKKEDRDLDEFTFAVFQRIYINDDENRLNQQIELNKMSLVLQPRVLKKMGYWKDEFDDIFCEATGYECDEMSLLKYDREDVGKLDINKLKPIMNEIPEKELRENLMIGNKEEITKKVEQYVNMGCEYFIFEIVNGASSKNAPFTYWDVSRILSDEIITKFRG
ncbi:MAG: LLM class flavin-dependent oxidoreductase [Candidatus Lokiarchaeota archaeon]|nr:LLM class flavin-dependent oxidoreductase [Candidatus Lokiarchaeota archaeon]